MSYSKSLLAIGQCAEAAEVAGSNTESAQTLREHAAELSKQVPGSQTLPDNRPLCRVIFCLLLCSSPGYAQSTTQSLKATMEHAGGLVQLWKCGRRWELRPPRLQQSCLWPSGKNAMILLEGLRSLCVQQLREERSKANKQVLLCRAQTWQRMALARRDSKGQPCSSQPGCPM